MPPQVSAADERLIASYQEAALRLNRILQTATTPQARAKALRMVESLVSELDQLTADYVNNQIPVHFRDGSKEAIDKLRGMRFPDIDTTFGTIHTEAVQQLAKDSSLRFANALEGVRRSAQAAISQAEKQQVIAKLLVNELEGGANPSAIVKQSLEDAGITSIQGARRWTLEDYASMLTRTVLAEAHNTGAMTRYVSNGVQFGQVIEHAAAPDGTCQFFNGKVVFLGDQRLLPPYHPNCMGGIKPFLGQPEAPIMSADDPRIPAEAKKLILRK